MDTPEDLEARKAYEDWAANFQKENGFFIGVPRSNYSTELQSNRESWFRGREAALNVTTLSFEDGGKGLFWDAPGKPTKKQFMERKQTVEYMDWFKQRASAITRNIDSVSNNDEFDEEYKRAYILGAKIFLDDMMPKEPQTKEGARVWKEWVEVNQLGAGDKYSIREGRASSGARFSSGATSETRSQGKLNRERLAEGSSVMEKLRRRNEVGSAPSTTEDVPFGDFDPSDFSPRGRESSRRMDRRVANADAEREKIMDGAKKTRTRFSSGQTPTKEPKKPSRPREPDNGPMTGKFIDIFRGVKSYQEMLDRYNEQEVIFFDYETTGFDPKNERPVQIGAVKMKGGKVVERFNVFTNPEKELSDWSRENLVDADGNPLTNEWLSGQPSISDAHRQLIEFFGDDALLGGQYTPFDLGFLEESLKSAGIEWKPAGVIDSKALSDELLPKWTPETEDGPFALNDDGSKYATNSLGPLSEYLGVDLTAWHTADADSEASAMIVQKILERAAEREDTPKHLLKVEDMPKIVLERKAKHKIAMDKYEEDMKSYNAELKAFKDSQSNERFSSGGQGATRESSPSLLNREDSGLPEKAQAAMQEKIDLKQDEVKQLEDANRRLNLAVEELKETGSWQGEKHDTRVNIEGTAPARTYTKEQIEEMAKAEGKSSEELVSQIINDAKASENRRNKIIETAKKEIEKLENRKKFVGKERGKNSFHIDELLADPEVAEDLKSRAEEVKQLSWRERNERFTDGEYIYVVHWGATELQGGALDPSRSRGQVGQGIMGNTRQVNDETARYMVSLRDSAKRDKKLLEEMRAQIEETGKIDFKKIAQSDSSDYLRAGKARQLVGADRDVESIDGVTTRRIDELMRDRDRTLSKLDKIADQLIEDNYQYSSTYRASQIESLFSSYGGRYAEEGSNDWGDNVGTSDSTGIHVFRVKIGEDATEENSVGETHLVGRHEPIASLVADNDSSPNNPAGDTWAGWLDMVIQQDKESRPDIELRIDGDNERQ